MNAALQTNRHPVYARLPADARLVRGPSDPKHQLPVYDEKNRKLGQKHAMLILKRSTTGAKYTAEVAARVQAKSGLARAVTVMGYYSPKPH